MTEFAFRARLLDITDMSVSLELPSSGALRHELRVLGNDSDAGYFVTDVNNQNKNIYFVLTIWFQN